jgi:16S rRNA (uracil1498-N3)-methyltransferase
MTLPYFYEPGISAHANVFTLSEDTSKHCIQVLRMKQGEQLNLTDGKGNSFTATILSPDKKNTEVKIDAAERSPQAVRKIIIAISLLKNTGRFEWFLEKATEIGVSGIIPLISDRTERQHFRHDRMNNILIAAMLQSRQTWLPALHEPMKFESVVPASHSRKFIAHCEEQHKQALTDFTLAGDVLMLIGPEGDFTPEEIHAALQNDFQPVSLGQTRLRTETAGVVAATLLMNL